VRFLPLRPPLLFLTVFAFAGAAAASSLDDELGRSEDRVRSAAYAIPRGRTVPGTGLPQRLERLGYERLRKRPERPGQWFWGHERLWIWRRAYRQGGVDHRAALFGLALRRSDGLILGAAAPDGRVLAYGADDAPRLEPELISESLSGDRARRYPLPLVELPEHAWRCLLAAEDARFFDHSGVDAKGIARALLANVKAGRVAQGGSTITQQLVKMRDLTPKRSFGRKMSEAVRALSLEAEHDKREILAAYLNHVYYGHVQGLSVHGIGAAARAYFGKDARELDLAESALLAAIIQGPNRLSPGRHPGRAKARRDWVLSRMGDLGWAGPRSLAEARASAIVLAPRAPEGAPARSLLAWIDEAVAEMTPKREAKGRGAVVETAIDPWLQDRAESLVAGKLAAMRASSRRLREAPLQAALIAIDSRTGAVVAQVGGDPRGGRGGLDRVRSARRQPGSTIKPLLLLEAFEDCGGRAPLAPSSRVSDEALRLDLPSGPWEPVNPGGTFRGVVSVREALTDSLNVPFVRVARWCGTAPTAGRLRRLGLDVPEDAPPSFALGALEVSPLELAGAYAALRAGRAVEARPFARLERPGGRRLRVSRPAVSRAVSPATSWLVRDALRSAVREGTAKIAAIDGEDVAAKTGTSSDRRDAWMAGEVAGLSIVVWVGLDDGARLGHGGASAAGPIWADFARAAVSTRTRLPARKPEEVIRRSIDPRTGLRVNDGHRRAEADWFRRGALPPRARWWRDDEPVPVVR
jgi:penicillin-binding protein 1B